VFRRARWLVTAVALLSSSAAPAQIFQSQGPAPRFGPRDAVQSGDAMPNGTEAGGTQAVLADPALGANTMFAGSVNGGVFVTNDGGNTWKALTDKQASLSIASLGLDPTDPTGKTIVAGVGITSNGAWGLGFEGRGGQQTGLLYTTNGGASWSALGNKATTLPGQSTLEGQSVIGVAARGSTILAATFEVQSPTTTVQAATGEGYGLYRSVNGGGKFDRVVTGPVTSLVADPANPARFYAAVTSPTDRTKTAIYVSNDTGANWNMVFTNTTPITGGGTNIIANGSANQLVPKLAAGPNGSVAIAFAEVGTGTLAGLYLSQNFGGAWSQLTAPATNPGKQALVNLAVAIDPTNKSIVYVAGDTNGRSPFTLGAFRVQLGDPNPVSLTDRFTGDDSTTHSDARVAVFNSANQLIVAGDGGIYLRTNPQSNSGIWQGLNGNLSAFELYNLAYDANSKRLVVATQDNGVALQSRPGSNLYTSLNGGDGVNAVINDRTLAGQKQSVIYSSSQELGRVPNAVFGPTRLIIDANGTPVSPFDPADPGGINITCDGGKSCASRVIGTSFSSPFVLNRIDPTRIAIGGTSVYVTQDTLTGANAPNAATIDLTLTNVGAAGATVTTIAYGAQDNVNALIVGAAGGRVLRGTTAGPPLENLPAYGAAGGEPPTGIVFDARTAQRFFVADSEKLWWTQNGAAPLAANVTFQDLTATDKWPKRFIRPTSVEFISTNGVNALLVGGLHEPFSCNSLPDGCVISSQQSPIIVADSDGNGNLSAFRAFGQGLPNALVAALSYNPIVDVLAAGSVGRGAFVLYDVTSNFPQATVLQLGLANNDSNPDASILTDGTAIGGTRFVRPLIKYGTGTLTIAGDATYTGGTTINGGVLQLGIGGTSGSILGNVAFCSDGTNPLCDPSTNKLLAFNRSDVYAFAGAISGPGQVQQIGPGTTILTANNTYTGGTIVSAGTLQVTNNNSVGTGAVTLNGGIFQAGANGLNFSNPFNVNITGGAVDTKGNTLTLVGVIADGNGPGALAKIGAGTLMLTAINSYTGMTFVNGGTLSVNGSIASSPVFVNAGGTVGGNGTVGPTTILAGGTLSPGNSVGTLTVNGNLVFAAASLYMVEVQGNTADRTNASGTAPLAGTVGVVNLGGTLARSYTILSAAAGRSGTFDSIATVNLPGFLTASLGYTPTDVQLNLTSGIGQISGLTRNQSAVATALDNSFNNGGGTLPALFGLSRAQLPAALDMLSGEGVSGTQETAFGAARMFTSIMMDQGAFWRNRETIDVNGVAFAGEPLQYAPAKKSKMADHPVFKEMAPPPPHQPRWRAWLTGFDGTAKLDGEAGIGSASLSLNTGGLAGGLDYQFAPDLLAGFALGGSSSNFSVRDRITSGHLEGAHFGGYGVKTWGPLYAAGTLSFSTFRNSETRSIVGIGPTEAATGDFGSNLVSGRVEVGAKQVFGGLAVTPFAAVQYAELWQNGFTEAKPAPQARSV
jgi:autotransporter-associated beta strand protein